MSRIIYENSRRFSGGPEYANSRNKLYEVFKHESDALDDYVYALNIYNTTTMSGLHNVPGNEAFRENYKRELENSMKKWYNLSKELDAVKMNSRKQVTHVTSAL